MPMALCEARRCDLRDSVFLGSRWLQPLGRSDGLMADALAWERLNPIVVLVIVVYVFVYTVTCATTIVPWIGITHGSLRDLAAFTLLTTVALYCYLLSVLVDPGAVPRGYEHDPEDVTAMYIQVKKKGGAARYCNKCQRPKPPRAHHCSICNRCVTRMDHHCPWLNSCGWHILESHRASQTLGWLLFDSSKEDASAFLWLTMLQIAAATVTLPLLAGVGSLLVWHVYSLSKNQTTVESHEGVTARAFYQGSGTQFQNPYDVGLKQNWQQVLGPQLVRWLVPTPAACGNGLKFSTSLSASQIQRLHVDQARQMQQELRI